MQQDANKPVAAVPSATVVLLRAGTSDPEILMVRRRAGDAFGDSYAFPGGVIDADESAARMFCRGTNAQAADTELGLSSGGLDFYSAAARELFEETGVLLAQDSQGDWPFSNNPDEKCLRRNLRKQLDNGNQAWAQLLQSQELFIACKKLHYFAFWETPLPLPKRWAARFFLAQIPPNQDAQHDGSELTDSCWMTAAEILVAARDGSMKLPFPTIKTLKTISDFSSVAELLQWARAQSAAGISKIRPVILKHNGKTRFVIPGDPDYPKDE